jgi:hypothetical protein
MFVNLSNHPSTKWTKEQIDEAIKLCPEVKFNGIVDIQFPEIDPAGNEEYIDNLSNEYLKKILELKDSIKNEDEDIIVHVMGEQTFCFSLISKLIKRRILCVASTTKRVATEEDGVKTSIFKFCKFRFYLNE